MLKALISSKIRRLILKVFLTNPENKYYVRQLSKLISVSVGSLHRELINLENEGILISNYLGNLRQFYVNKEHPLYKEIKQIISKTEGIEGRLKDYLKDTPGLKTIFIYGSFAEGKERADSDIDLFLLGQPSEDKLINKISDLEKEFTREINYTIYTKSDFKREKKKRNSFILDLMKHPKVFIKGKESDLR
ncbi:MAG: nucleotidyltransferase domain-containing protein [Candidatus Omnitrophica bacterium]|nr:nucleotidyltransferase domain-containing protein [Candidatus Omnitrophota bacterium]